MIPYTRPYLPSRDKLDRYIDSIYARQWLTNNGELVQELTHRLEGYLGVENLLLVANGTLALQIAYRALGISGQVAGEAPEAITTPFTFIATASSLKWDGVEPVFVDIDADTWCLDPDNIKAAITPRTRAIVPVHVFGNPCEVEAIGAIARRHGLKVVYDGAHAFGVTYKGESLLKHGDATTLSFHATKLFHTIEGGAIVFKRKEDLERARKMINFGITGPETIEELGINAKMNEFQAAIGLCVLDEMPYNLKARHRVVEQYHQLLPDILKLQQWHSHSTRTPAYMPVLLPSEETVKKLQRHLQKAGVQSRRYFHPSLNKISHFHDQAKLKKTKKTGSRIICLPLHHNLTTDDQKKISELIKGLL